MDHSPFPLFSAASRARLRPDRGLLRRVRRAVAAARRIPREELSPAGVWIEDHARFLLEEADALRLALRPAPRLPGGQGAARVLRLAREICRAEEGKVEEALILWEPRIRDVEVRATRAEAGRLNIEISYVVRTTNNPYNLVYPFYINEGMTEEF